MNTAGKAIVSQELSLSLSLFLTHTGSCTLPAFHIHVRVVTLFLNCTHALTLPFALPLSTFKFSCSLSLPIFLTFNAPDHSLFLIHTLLSPSFDIQMLLITLFLMHTLCTLFLSIRSTFKYSLVALSLPPSPLSNSHSSDTHTCTSLSLLLFLFSHLSTHDLFSLPIFAIDQYPGQSPLSCYINFFGLSLGQISYD